jgi:hypothetical protein
VINGELDLLNTFAGTGRLTGAKVRGNFAGPPPNLS